MEKNTTFTQGKILQPLILFALPVLFALFLQAMYGAVDLLVVGRFGSSAGISGVATGGSLVNLFTFVVTALTMGVTVLIGRYIDSLARYDVQVGQVLVTAEDLMKRHHYQNTHRQIERLLDLGVLPIINENDAVATQEIKFGDNDRIAALTANLVKADVLLVPHHGSKTSSSPAFLDAVQPRTALVQAGYRNRFGHPAPEVLQRYAQRQVPVVESARCGAAIWSSARPDVVECERDKGRRYWQHTVP